MKILLIEDEAIIHDSLVDNFTFEGYEVDSAYDGYEGLDMAFSRVYDLIILDLMLPKIEGMEILKKIRKKQIETPVIIISAKTEEFVKLEGFREGADDYICKPFSLPELLARVKVVLKRVMQKDTKKEFLIGKGIFNFEAYTLTIDDKIIKCSKFEILILKLLSSNINKIFSRSEILHYAWGADNFPTDRTIDNYIVKLRKKLQECVGSSKQDILESVYGTGYKLNIK